MENGKIYGKGGVFSSNLVGYIENGKVYNRGGIFSSNIVGYFEGGMMSGAAAAAILLIL
mgnify:FL=1